MRIKEPVILLAEDDTDDQEFISLALNKISSSHQVYIANNGREALEYLQTLEARELPCVIVLDLNMPVLDGLQTLDELNKLKAYSHIPKVIFTTSDSEEDKRKALSYGATDYLVKPHNMTEIVKSLERILNYC